MPKITLEEAIEDFDDAQDKYMGQPLWVHLKKTYNVRSQWDLFPLSSGKIDFLINTANLDPEDLEIFLKGFIIYYQKRQVGYSKSHKDQNIREKLFDQDIRENYIKIAEDSLEYLQNLMKSDPIPPVPQSQVSNLVKLKNQLLFVKLDQTYIKICGSIIGHAYGDALGAPFEFPPFPEFKKKLKLDNPIKRRRQWGRPQETPVGQITDDTEMAIALLHVLISGYTKDKAIIEYMQWVNNLHCKPDCQGNAPFCGNNTRELFVIPNTSKQENYINLYNARFKKQFPNGQRKEDSQSNGCLMRAYPLAFINNIDIIKTDVFITNPSNFSFEAVRVYVLAIRMALLGFGKHRIKSEISSQINDPLLKVIYKKAVNNIYLDVVTGKGEKKEEGEGRPRGWIGYGFYCAFWAFFNFRNYKAGVDAVICLGPPENKNKKAFICDKTEKQKLVGDTDTNGAIAGALLGAYYGILKMCDNSNLREDLKILVRVDTTKGDIIRPLRYYPNWTNFENLTTESLKLFIKSLRVGVSALQLT